LTAVRPHRPPGSPFAEGALAPPHHYLLARSAIVMARRTRYERHPPAAARADKRSFVRGSHYGTRTAIDKAHHRGRIACKTGWEGGVATHGEKSFSQSLVAHRTAIPRADLCKAIQKISKIHMRGDACHKPCLPCDRRLRCFRLHSSENSPMH